MTQNTNSRLPSPCAQIQQNLSAEFDGEETLLAMSIIDQHLEHCAECAKYQVAIDTLHSIVQRETRPTSDIDLLWERVLEDIKDESDLDSTHLRSFHDTPKWVIGMALAASILIGVFAGNHFIKLRHHRIAPLVSETIRDFETFMVRGEPLDINTENVNNVVDWISAKIDFNIPDVFVQPPEGFTTQGGRLCSFLNRRSAFFYYEKEQGVLSLYVMKADGLKMPESGHYRTGTTQNGLTTVSWTRDDLAYVIVSDLSTQEAVKFASRS